MDEDTQDDDIEITEENIAQQLKELKGQLKICRAEKSEYLAGWQRAKADFINARRDEEKHNEEAIRYRTESMVREFLGLADSIDMALEHEKSESITHIHRQLNEILKRQGVQTIESIKKPFDPALHEALTEVEVANPIEDGVVMEELQKGYMMNNRVLRPSKVKVGSYKQNEE